MGLFLLPVAWAFGSGHQAIGIVLMVAVLVVPEVVLVLLSIRRSRRLAKEARTRRGRTG